MAKSAGERRREKSSTCFSAGRTILLPGARILHIFKDLFCAAAAVRAMTVRATARTLYPGRRRREYCARHGPISNLTSTCSSYNICAYDKTLETQAVFPIFFFFFVNSRVHTRRDDLPRSMIIRYKCRVFYFVFYSVPQTSSTLCVHYALVRARFTWRRRRLDRENVLG